MQNAYVKHSLRKNTGRMKPPCTVKKSDTKHNFQHHKLNKNFKISKNRRLICTNFYAAIYQLLQNNAIEYSGLLKCYAVTTGK